MPKGVWFWLAAVLLLSLRIDAHPAADETEAGLHRLLGVWDFTAWEDEKESFIARLFIDELSTKQLPGRPAPVVFVRGKTYYGVPLVGHDVQADFPSPGDPFQYNIGWEDPTRKGVEILCKFNFLSSARVGGIVRTMFHNTKTQSQPIRMTGIRLCQHKEPCPYR